MKYLMLSLILLTSLHAQVKAKVMATGTGHVVNLGWNAPTATNITGTNIYRGTTAGGENYTAPINTTLLPATATTFVDTTVSAMNTYFYTAEFVCPTCKPTNSNPSNEVVATVPADAQPSPPVLTLGTIAQNKVPLNWVNPTQAGMQISSTNVYRCAASKCTAPPKIAQTSGTTFLDTCTVKNKTCYYQVSNNVTFNGKKETSPRSNIVTAKVN